MPQHYLKFITDARSEKIAHLAERPHAELAWYFTKSRLVLFFVASLCVCVLRSDARRETLSRPLRHSDPAEGI